MNMLEFQFRTTGDQALLAVLKGIYHKIPDAVKKATAKSAMNLSTMIVKGVRSQAPGGKRFKALEESTRKMKKSSKALIHHGDLVRSIRAEEVRIESGNSAWFVGVNRTAKDRDGKTLWNLAEIHEFGTEDFIIPISAKMRGWWKWQVKRGVFRAPLNPKAQNLLHPGVPARPFLTPSYDVWKQKAEENWVKFVQEAILPKVKK
jgi:hypothetical protein